MSKKNVPKPPTLKELSQQLNQTFVVQLLRGIVDQLHDPDVDWNKVIAFAGEAKVRDIINELTERLDNYVSGQANRKSRQRK